MGKFIDSFGTTVRHGDIVEIIQTYDSRSGQGQKCWVEWDSRKGMYRYHHKVVDLYTSSDFNGVHSFRKVKEKKSN